MEIKYVEYPRNKILYEYFFLFKNKVDTLSVKLINKMKLVVIKKIKHIFE